MTEHLNKTEYAEYLKEQRAKHRTDALEWAKSQSNAQMLDTLIQQRGIIADINREAEREALEFTAWEQALTDELLRRMASEGVKSFKVDGSGMATITSRRQFSINDPDKLLEHVKTTNSIAIFGSALKKAEVEIFEAENNGNLPDGITAHTAHSIRITQSK